MTLAIPQAIQHDIAQRLSVALKSFWLSAGGCINNGGRLTTDRGNLFIKWNDAHAFPGMFIAEAKGLSLLKEAGGLSIPEVICAGESGTWQYLVLEYVEEARRAPRYWEQFAEGLAAIHSRSQSGPGLDHHNYIGSLPQDNTTTASWVEFFIERRLAPLVKLAVEKGRLEGKAVKAFELLYTRLPGIIPEEPASLLHGDLWGGNLMTNERGMPCLIDPAVYYGHREVDIAMTQLFGGFDSRWIEHYQACHPLAPGYRERLELYNLYPLLVHLNLFGGGYAAQAASVVRKFI